MSSASPPPPDDDDFFVTDGTGDPKHTSETKEKQLDDGKEEAIITTLTSLCSNLKADPSFYRTSPVAAPILDIFSYASSHPQEHPQEYPLSASSRPTPSTVGHTDATLSTGFAEDMSSGHHVPDPNAPPTLKIVEYSTKYIKQNFGQGRRREMNRVSMTTMMALDGDGKPVLVKVATQLNRCIGGVKVGSIIKATQYHVIYFKMSSAGEDRVAMLLLNYEVVGYIEATESEVSSARNRIAVASKDESEAGAVVDSKAVVDNVDEHFDEVLEDIECTESNRLCSLYGVSFDNACICETIPVDSHIFKDVKSDCWFITKADEDLTPKNRRNIYYWWYATNIYLICGKGKREKMPDCLVKSIRKFIPEPTGRNVGFKKAEISNGNSKRQRKR